jgi:hypothetical protein
MCAISAAALIGGLITLVVLWPYGVLVAFTVAPFGGSFFALVAGLLLALLRATAEWKPRRKEEH